MTNAAEALAAICPGAQNLTDGGLRYVYLPQLALPVGATPQRMDCLLCLDQRDGYPTRLFFAAQVTPNPTTPRSAALNWNGNTRILERNWVAFSWKDVRAAQHPVSILTAHLDAVR